MCIRHVKYVENNKENNLINSISKEEIKIIKKQYRDNSKAKIKE